MGFVSKYMGAWVLMLAASVGLMLVATFVSLIGGGDIAVLFVLMFNATATGFIFLTMLPFGVAIIGAVIFYDVFSPFLAPVLQWGLDIFGAPFFAIIEGFTGLDIPYSPATVVPEYINPAEAAFAFYQLLAAYKELLITRIPTAG